MVVVMIVAFMVGWTPYAVFSLLVTSHPSIKLDPRLASIPAFFSKTAAVYNPIIYVFMNKQVTESFHAPKGILHLIQADWWRWLVCKGCRRWPESKYFSKCGGKESESRALCHCTQQMEASAE